MENLSKKIGLKMADELDASKEQGEIFAYGIFALIQIFLSLSLVTIIGSFFNVAFEAFIISIISSILRKYSGGVHASKPSICILIGTLICVSQALIVKYCIFPIVNLNLLLIINTITFVISYYLIFKYAPVDSIKKRIKTEIKKKRMRRLSLKVLTIYLISSLILITLTLILDKSNISVYSLCICIGVCWQVFTLTKLGHMLLSKL